MGSKIGTLCFLNGWALEKHILRMRQKNERFKQNGGWPFIRGQALDNGIYINRFPVAIFELSNSSK